MLSDPNPGWNWIMFADNTVNAYYTIDQKKEMSIYADDLVVSTSYIGPDYVIPGPSTPCDLSGDGSVNAVDLQRLANGILTPPTPDGSDVNHDGQANALDVQVLVNVILGKGACP